MGAPPRLSSHDLLVTADGVLVSPTVWSQQQASMHKQLLHRLTGHVVVASSHSSSKEFLGLGVWHVPKVCASKTNAEHNLAQVGHSQLHWLYAAATRTLGPPVMQPYPSDHERTKQYPSLRSGPNWALSVNQEKLLRRPRTACQLSFWAFGREHRGPVTRLACLDCRSRQWPL